MDAIKTTGLTKYYGKARGIIDLNLCVPEGEFFGFIGPNGAGKSTTIRTLLGLISSSSGSAEILGMDMVKERQKILDCVSYLPSEAVFYPGMRVRDVLKLSAGLRKKDCREEAARLCERLELDTARKVEELSFGNRKKVAIVCALQHRPRLLVLDEPTSGLDPVSRDELTELLRRLVADGARSVLFSTHITSDLEKCATHIAFIKDGEMQYTGSLDDFRDHYKDVGVTLEDIIVHVERRPLDEGAII